jgi:hypothetical protein
MPDVSLVASGYLWRCPECDTGNVSNTVCVDKVQCVECEAEWPVFEIRHRTHDYDIQPGKAIGALRSVKVEVPAEEVDEDDEYIHEEKGKYYRYVKTMIENGGVLLVATGYTWTCPECDAPQYLRSPLEQDDDLIVEGCDEIRVACEVCGSECGVSGVYHLHNHMRFGPPIKLSSIFIPPVKEVRRDPSDQS